MRDKPDEKVVLELEGEEAERGISLASLESFIEHFRRALVDFDRSRRAEPTRRAGHPKTREQQVTAFRVVRLRPGSAIIELETTSPVPEEQERIEDVEMLALQNLASLVAAIEGTDPLEPDVTESIAAARRALGVDGRIGLVVAGRRRRKKKVVIDEHRIEDLRARKPRAVQATTQITGRLHMIDVDPLRVGIRASTGVEWICRYEPELEKRILQFLKMNVVATGHGLLTSASRGDFEIESIEALAEHEQTQLFSAERRPLQDLLDRQDVRPQGWDFFADPDWEDDEASQEYLEALLEPEPRL